MLAIKDEYVEPAIGHATAKNTDLLGEENQSKRYKTAEKKTLGPRLSTREADPSDKNGCIRWTVDYFPSFFSIS
jgi:hypothetical protein